jgi:PAS domain S-box-containing protein
MNVPQTDKNQPANEHVKFFLAAIVESSQDSIVTIDLNRVITTWNRSAEKLYGYRAEEVIDKSLDLVMLPQDIKT